MRFLLVATLIAALSSTAAHSAFRSDQSTEHLPRVFLLDAKTLAGQRQSGDSALATVVREAADGAMKEGPFSVMDKDRVPPSGDKHDYMSQGPYWWPNPKTPNGLPYIRRDGERNPEILKLSDHDNRERMQRASLALALGFYLTGKESYAARAALLLRTWFLEPATRMNPNLNFGQGIPGVTTGRGTGIIDTVGLTDVVDAVGLLAGSTNWSANDQKGMEKWFADYLEWLRQSANGRDEAKATNNHGTFYDMQVADFALFTNQTKLARDVIEEARQKRIARQVEQNGSQPLEAARTRGFSYSVFNLTGLMDLAELGEHAEVDLWNFHTDDGRSIRRALDFLVPYAAGNKKWEHQQITEFKPQDLTPLLLQASAKFHSAEYEKAAQTIGIPSHDLKAALLQAQLKAEAAGAEKAHAGLPATRGSGKR
ncbi:MAG TPA: alginate lyase family protein [Candidatus Angelobacter sp.]|nr:alginate lyase family protein [Candidatus Angelobacter sp.]